MSRMNFRGHIGKRDYAVNTVQPTISGSAISGQTLTGTAGTWTSSESLVTGYVYQWQVATAPNFDNWADDTGSTASTLVLAAGHIGKKIRLNVAAINGDGQANYVPTLPTAVVQDAPAVPLSISGTPVTSAIQSSPASFVVSFDGGTGAYTPSLINAPSGSSVTLLSNGNQATVVLGTASAGSFGGIIVRVSDGSTTADLASFTLNVEAAGTLPTLTVGTGWTADLTGTANLGSSTNPGYGYTPPVFWANPYFDELTGDTILEALTFHTGTQANLTAVGNPTYGINKVEASADNGPWVTIPVSYSAVTNRYSFRFKVRASDWADGAPVISGTIKREIRLRITPQNGNQRIAQGDPITIYACGYRFTTNAGGTLFSTVKYVDSVNGNDTTGTGSSGSPYKTLAKATDVLANANSNKPGGGIIKCKPGNYQLNSLASSDYTDNQRFLVVQADDGVDPTTVIINSYSSRGLRAPKVRFKNLSWSITYTNQAGWTILMDNVVCDRGVGLLKSGDVAPVSAAGLIMYVGGSITNYPRGPNYARLVRDHTCYTIASDVWSNSICVLNSSVDTVTGGTDITTGKNYHPDTFQLVGTVGGNYSGPGCFYNISSTTGTMSAQGPFLANMATWTSLFWINTNLVLQPSPIRNAIQLSDGQLRNSIFYNFSLTNGYNEFGIAGANYNGLGGTTDDVQGVNMTFTNLSSNTIPASITQLTPP